MEQTSPANLKIGLIICLLALMGVGYAFYVRKTSYLLVPATIERVESRCYRYAGERPSSAADLMASDNVDCASLGGTSGIAFVLAFSYRYSSPVDNKSYVDTGIFYQQERLSRIKAGDVIQAYAHKREATESFLEIGAL
jgi:hypothetical protein